MGIHCLRLLQLQENHFAHKRDTGSLGKETNITLVDEGTKEKSHISSFTVSHLLLHDVHIS